MDYGIKTIDRDFEGLYYSVNRFAGDGTKTLWDINFAGGYLSREDVKAYTIEEGQAIENPVTIRFVNDWQVEVLPAIPSGYELYIYRDSPKAIPLIEYTNASILTGEMLNIMARQSIFNVAEMVDRFRITDQKVIDTLDAALNAVELSNTAITIANESKKVAEQAAEDSEIANRQSTDALNKSDNAVITANSAKSLAETASILANQASELSIQADNNANYALNASTESLRLSSQAIKDSEEALSRVIVAEKAAVDAQEYAKEIADGFADTLAEAQQAVKDSKEALEAVNTVLSRVDEMEDIVNSFSGELDKKWNIQETVGNTTGKVMREGAYGLGSKTKILPTTVNIDLDDIETGFYTTSGEYEGTYPEDYVGNLTGQLIVLKRNTVDPTISHIFVAGTSGGVFNGNIYHRNKITGVSEWSKWIKLYSENNTKTDRNGVIHSGTKTPINTLNTSDLTDHIQAGLNQPVTSSAVKGELDKKADKSELVNKWDVQQTIGQGALLRELVPYYGGTVGFWSESGPEWLFGVTLSTGVSPLHNLKIYTEHGLRTGVRYVKNWGEGQQYWGSFYTTDNTHLDVNGFLKGASPVVQVFANRIESNGQFKYEPTLQKLGEGIYKVVCDISLAKGEFVGDWYIELPKNRYGDPYFNVEYERTYDGVILRVYERIELYVPSDRVIYDRNGNLVEVKEKLVLNGELIDLKPEWRCIDLRFKEEETINGEGDEKGYD